MRILVVSNYYPPLEMGGWPQLTCDIVDRLRERGHKLLVLTSRHQRERLTAPEKDIHRVLYPESADRDHYHPHYVLTDRWHEHENSRFLKEAFNSFIPEVLFIHGLWNMSCRVALDAERLCPNRVVYYMASNWPIEMDAHTSYWTTPTKRPWLRLPKKLVGALVQKNLLSSAIGQTLKFDRVLCVSKYIQDCLIHQLGLPVQHTQVLYNGIDVNAFSPRPYKRNDDNDLKLIYAGGFWEHKGVFSAIEAIDHLVNRLGVRNIHLALVGAGHPEYVAKMKRQISELDLEDFVSFTDRVPRGQMPSLLQAYDILLFPSTGPEALARIVQEAMACGVLVIGSTAGGTPEILQDGKNGLAFKAGDAKMLAEKIALAASNRELRDCLTRAARCTVEERFTIEGMVDRLEEYFASL